MTAQDVPDALAAYLELRRQDRLQDIEDALGAMNPREHRLVREAAVMGYVRGSMAADAANGAAFKTAIPKDSQILSTVVDACLAMSDIYPTMGRMLRIGAKRRAVQ